MIPRGKLSISYSHLFRGMMYCLQGSGYDTDIAGENNFVCLSVRTGFDLALQALQFPPVSEMLVTDINIPDMFSIIEHHDIKIVPLPVDKYTLNISAADVEAAITPNTRAVLITHLFGGIMDIEGITAIAQKHKLIVFEDCAQAYAGNTYYGDPASDVVMFSFGFIKTNTAGSGALLTIKSNNMFKAVNALHALYPQQKTRRYFKKLIKAALVKILTTPIVYTLFYKLITAVHLDFEEVVGRFTKGFPGDDVIKKIRQQICPANKRVILRKLECFSQRTIAERIALANEVLFNLAHQCRIGQMNARNTYWVMPVEAENPELVVATLRTNGFDASQKASSLVKLHSYNGSAVQNKLQLNKLVYLPVYPAMTQADRQRLNKLLREMLTSNAR